MQVSGRGPPPRRTGGLPASATPLIGRDAELAALGAAITRADERLITLTGPPGVGKTRLAIAAAAAVGSRFRDGVVFVDLTPVRDPDLVLPEVARALGLRDLPGRPLPDRILTAVAERDLLIVVDNMEHVLDAGPALAALLAECPLLRLLATSRERLHLRGEREYPVAPLELPTPGDVDDLERLAETPSMSMLLHRVRGFQPDFAVTSANAAALAEICIRLDGLPLALELATARLKLFTAGELTFRLRHRMQLLTSGARDGPDRHRTLRAALTWSHDLLVPDERVLFRRLSVFVGGWTLEAAEQVCGVADVVETTASLVDKSLVRRHTPAGAIAEFGLLESIREFAAERLDDQGETETIRAQHTRYYTAHAVRMEGLIGTGEETLSVWKIGTAERNLHAAFQHAWDNGRSDQALPLAAVLGWCLYTRGHIGQGQATLDRALALADAGPDRPPGPALAGALQIAAVLTVARGEFDRAEELLDRALRIVERFDDLRRRAFDSAFRGQVARARGDHAGAVAHHDRARALYARLGSAPGVAWSHYDLGLLDRRRGDVAGAIEHLEESLAQFRDTGYAWAVGCVAWALATVELRRGRVEKAAALLAEALDEVEAAGDGRGLAQTLEATAGVACEQGAYRSAGQLLGAAAVLRERLAAPLPDEDRGAHHALSQQVRQALGPDEADRARSSGRRLSNAQVGAIARRVLRASQLTPREQQVARLIASGRTNRQIGRELGIAEKTTEVHVHHIIGKLGARCRSEVAAWVGAQGAGGPGADSTHA